MYKRNFKNVEKLNMKILLSILLLVNTVAVYAQTDFSGKWKLNLDKTQFNETPGADASTISGGLFVEQKKNAITLQRGEKPKETLNIDSYDEIEVMIVGMEGSKAKVSMKSTADKKGLIETRTYSYPESETAEIAAKKTRTWSLSDDKKTLTIKDHIETTQGKMFDMVLVYERQ
jgi:hypothetical protein